MVMCLAENESYMYLVFGIVYSSKLISIWYTIVYSRKLKLLVLGFVGKVVACILLEAIFVCIWLKVKFIWYFVFEGYVTEMGILLRLKVKTFKKGIPALLLFPTWAPSSLPIPGCRDCVVPARGWLMRDGLLTQAKEELRKNTIS